MLGHVHEPQPLRRVAQVIRGLDVIQPLAFIALGGILLCHSHSDFVKSFGNFSHNPNDYTAVLQGARQNGVGSGSSLTA